MFGRDFTQHFYSNIQTNLIYLISAGAAENANCISAEG